MFKLYNLLRFIGTNIFLKQFKTQKCLRVFLTQKSRVRIETGNLCFPVDEQTITYLLSRIVDQAGIDCNAKNNLRILG